MSRNNNYSEALSRAASLCSRAEKCEDDIEKKLQDWGVIKEDIDKIINYLTQHKYIDNERFCGAYIRDKINFSGWGRIKISYNLRCKKIPRSIIEEQMKENISEDIYSKKLTNLLLQKNQLIIETDTNKKKEKLLRFASSRGFEFDIAWNTIENLS